MVDLFNISGNVSGSPTTYAVVIHVSNPISGISFDSTLDLLSCEDSSGCPIEIPSSFCSQSAIISVTIEAANKQQAEPLSFAIIECGNKFVEIVYKDISESSDSESVISCVFLNRADTSEKTCCVTHRICDQRARPLKLNDQVCKKDFLHSIELDMTLSDHAQLYCYTAITGNDTYSMMIEGSFDFITGSDRGNSSDTILKITIASVMPFLISVSVGTAIVAVIFKIISSRRRPNYRQLNNEELEMQDLTPFNVPRTLRVHKVGEDCELRQFIIDTLSVEFKRGHTYYEFTNDVENILKGKTVLLQDINLKGKDTKLKLLRLILPKEATAAKYSKGISRDYFGRHYKVFIQSFGSGSRHLPRDSSILYNHDDQVEPDILPLVPVCPEHFAHKVIDSEKGCTVQQFCTQYRLNPTAFNVFLTLEHTPERMIDQKTRDVILMDRESGELFTGPFARQILNPRNGGEIQPDNKKWKIFVLLKRDKQGLVLQKKSEILYQDSRYIHGKYSVLEVDKDCVRMSKFIEAKLGCKYKDGKAFYEAEKEEDLLYCKKILRPQKRELSCKQVVLQSLVEYFYAIDGVPAKGVKPEKLQLEHHKVFIQSTSQGSRCLTKGEKLLYLEAASSTPIPALQKDVEA